MGETKTKTKTRCISLVGKGMSLGAGKVDVEKSAMVVRRD